MPRDDAPTALRGTLAIAALAGDGVELSARSTFDPVADRELWSDFAADGRLEPGGGPSEGGRPADRASGAAVAATVVLGPGERRSVRFAIAWDLPVVEFGAGRRWWKRYTKAWGRTGDARGRPRAPRPRRGARPGARAIEAWQAPYLDDPARPTGTRWRCSTSCTSSSTAARSGSTARWAARSPDPDDIGRFALLECVDYPFYDTVDVDFYASFALLEVFPELELRGIRDLLEAIPVDLPEIVTIEASGARAPRKVGGTVPHDVGGPQDDPFIRPNWYTFQDVNDWKDLGPSSSSRRGATRSRPGRRRATR